jgi:hypothetical protein
MSVLVQRASVSILTALFCLGLLPQIPEAEIQHQLYLSISRNSIGQFGDAIKNGADIFSPTGKNCLVMAAEHDADRIVKLIVGWVRPGPDGQEWHRRELSWAGLARIIHQC